MFQRVLPNEGAADQIAYLLNKYNKLKSLYTRASILDSPATYVVETLGTEVLGCAAIEKQAYTVSELKHIVVRPKWRKTGLAGQLVRAAISRSKTPIIYATVREDNIASIKLLTREGMQLSGEYTTEARKLLVFITTSFQWKQKTS